MSVKLDYEAVQPSDGSIIKGEIEAGSEREAIRKLESDGMIVTDVQIQSDKQVSRFQRDVTRQEVVLALFELATLLESGVSIAEAVESQSESDYHPKLNEFFNSVNQRLRSGESLAHAVDHSDLAIPDYVVQLIQSGEISGGLPACLRKGVEQMEYELDIASQFRSALIYPAILLLSGVLAIGLIFVLVVPRFAHILDRGADLPWLATAVLTAGMFFNDHYPVLIALLCFVVGASIWYLRMPHVRSAVYNQLASWPVLGTWLLETEIARWSAMMATMIGSRVELVTSLNLAASGMGIEDKKKSLERVNDGVRQGESLSKALSDQRVLTSTATNLIRVGEKSGALAPMLHSVAKLYDVKCKNRMTTVVALIEPLAILLIGIVIGVLVLGIILAITSINTVSI
ncbi:MAG: type II secretion system F family protein [Pseudomonadales bacterium]|nr:type II secretion system F family protein [Pseudomonadales bacterium]MBO6596143.1 type II secretion system F family protein [Pseudomonadales bacterium]MBO6822623.1 type II secretion system F family protein [Pseudomonadales bacterium]